MAAASEVALSLLLSLFLAGSAGALESREVPVGVFQRVVFSGAATVHLTQGATAKLAVSGDADAFASLLVENHGGVLHIDAPDADLLLELQVAGLKAFVASGAARISGDDLAFDDLLLVGSGAGSFAMRRLEARRLEVRGRGATRFDLTGQVADQRVDLSGSGAYEARELISERVHASASGSARVWLWVEERLDVDVGGAARVRYAGSPEVRQQVSGIGRVVRLKEILI